MGKFVITTRKNGEFQYNLKADSGRVILGSEGYSTKAALKNAIRSAQRLAQNEKNFQRMTAKNGKYYFNLRAENGQVIGSSEMYESEAGREHGVVSVMNHSQTDVIEDKTKD